MAKALRTWVEDEVAPLAGKSTAWLAQFHFFRDPHRPRFVDPTHFFSPADGVIVYQRVVEPDEPLVEIKGGAYTLRQALRAPRYPHRSLVIGVFMTFYDVHVNRVPYPGSLSYRRLDALDTRNRPMLDVENDLLELLRVDLSRTDYLRRNQRVVNRVVSPRLRLPYYVLQVADHAVDCILPFDLAQNVPRRQGDRFSQIRYGSQVDLVIPLSPGLELEPVQRVTDHVQAGIDPLVRVHGLDPTTRRSA
ncbi:phosphatidylserine decarboxylase [Actinosynnema sp. NPDC053489]|uniref:phosphatidylserine decarboxylase n=1 Tax=Actinosynnema sp. NPDC053489 TaxID=3363916 RepID=UPI0037C6059A